MTEPIAYKSSQVFSIRGTPTQLQKFSKDGLSWEWSYSEAFAPLDSWRKIDNCGYLSWKFEWDEEAMKKNGVYGFEGVITVWNVKKANPTTSFRFKVILKKSGECIRKRIGTLDEMAWAATDSRLFFQFEFTLNKITKPVDDVYQDREVNDAVLVVDGVKINVNKTNLAIRSDYFNTLFNSEFKEKLMDEIPINDVKYQEFVSFINVIHPINPEPVTDDNAVFLLKLADRFMMPVVTRQVENHLLSGTDFSIGDLLKLADRYKLKKLLKKCLGMFTTTDQVKMFNKSFDYLELSDSVRLKLFDSVMKMLK